MASAGSRLKDALTTHMQLHQRAYGTTKIRPKANWAFDIAEQIAMDNLLFDAFIIERLHLRIKGVAESVKLNESFERSVLSGVTNAHANRARFDCRHGGLTGKVAPFPRIGGALVSDKLERYGFHIAVSDIVARTEQVGQVIACCIDTDHAILYVVVSALEKVADLSQHSSLWHERDLDRQLWRVDDVSECLTWQNTPGREVVVVRM